MQEIRRTYLDNNATTPMAPEVLEAMLPFYRESFGNPSSIHALGQNVKVAVDEAREEVAALLEAEPG
ncbi:MAG: aminotransferase class V-fold PLP-dependent enzyme, partial [Dehalococcoidia bacterium]